MGAHVASFGNAEDISSKRKEKKLQTLGIAVLNNVYVLYTIEQARGNKRPKTEDTPIREQTNLISQTKLECLNDYPSPGKQNPNCMIP